MIHRLTASQSPFPIREATRPGSISKTRCSPYDGLPSPSKTENSNAGDGLGSPSYRRREESPIVNPRRASHRREGFSLLEVVLALAIAAIALTLLAQLVGVANRSAASSRDLTQAQLIAESIMAELSSGVMLPQSTSGVWELDPTWMFDAQVVPGASENLSVVTVTVTQTIEIDPVSFTLNQFLFIPPEPVEEETETTETEDGGAA